jgi:hypothetical protein
MTSFIETQRHWSNSCLWQGGARLISLSLPVKRNKLLGLAHCFSSGLADEVVRQVANIPASASAMISADYWVSSSVHGLRRGILIPSVPPKVPPVADAIIILFLKTPADPDRPCGLSNIIPTQGL